MTNNNIAVIDVETTGLSPWRNDRILEIAVVVISPDGEIHKEYETLVNPNRDLGPTRIHGISAEHVLSAPIFADIAGDVLAILSSASVIAGHNVSFDKNFIVKEYERIGVKIPEIPLLCTCRLFGRNSLEACCDELGITFDGTPHRALIDARATARLVSHLYAEDSTLLEKHRIGKVHWPVVKKTGMPCYTREHAQSILREPPRFLQRIARMMHHDINAATSEILAYQALIDRILEDRTIDTCEENTLVDAALEWELSQKQINEVHKTYIHNLAVLALADGVVSNAELRDLHVVARLLGQDSSIIDDVLDTAAVQLAAAKPSKTKSAGTGELSGMRVCFTGELCSTIGGQPITRDIAETLAENAGLKVANSVTKKLDILVVADPNTQSGKARKAKKYGIRILADTVFWRMIGATVD